MTDTTLTLGRRDFTLKPLKLGQLRHLLDALDATAGKTGGALIETAAKVIAAGLAPAHPDVTADNVLDLEAGLDELNTAMAAVLELAGLKPLGEPQPMAGASVPSTPPSPPAVATSIARLTA